MARCIGAGRLARTFEQNLHRHDPAFHTPSVAFGDTFPAPRRRGARQIADRVVFMDNGEVLEINAPAPFFDDPQHPRTRLFLSQS